MNGPQLVNNGYRVMEPRSIQAQTGDQLLEPPAPGSQENPLLPLSKLPEFSKKAIENGRPYEYLHLSTGKSGNLLPNRTQKQGISLQGPRAGGKRLFLARAGK